MCVSIGLTIGKVPVVGVVYNPIMDEVKDFFPPHGCIVAISLQVSLVVTCYTTINSFPKMMWLQ